MDTELAQAKNYALRLLKVRPRSRRELTERLGRKNFSPEIIGSVIGLYAQAGYINDEQFARLWVASRMRQRPRAKRVIRYELLKKGISREIADQALSGIDDLAERQTAQTLAQRKLEKLAGLADPVKVRRLAGYLSRRGFNPGLVINIVNKLIKPC
ncbi:MAG: regulatory protein RecX [Candidatus Omnitrophica bacterium]|nr:regulatory protein RecX [Candidatus Omnitrophota bacterium]